MVASTGELLWSPTPDLEGWEAVVIWCGTEAMRSGEVMAWGVVMGHNEGSSSCGGKRGVEGRCGWPPARYALSLPWREENRRGGRRGERKKGA